MISLIINTDGKAHEISIDDLIDLIASRIQERDRVIIKSNSLQMDVITNHITSVIESQMDAEDDEVKQEYQVLS